MTLPKTFAIATLCCLSAVAHAELQLQPDKEPQSVVAGDGRTITTIWRNAGDNAAVADIRTRLFQTTFATAVQLADQPWKTLEVLPQQTILESAPFNFPAVRAKTTFVIQWLEHTNVVLGRTTVLVYPTNLLHELQLMTGENQANLGVLDPRHQIKLVLKQSALPFVDLEAARLDDFAGKLAIVGPCKPEDPEWNGLADRIARLAKKGTPVVWIQSPPSRPGKPCPSFYAVPENEVAVIVVQPELVADLATNPKSQLDLIYFCHLALNPLPAVLPELSPDHEPQSL
jgi:hypothetical protein